LILLGPYRWTGSKRCKFSSFLSVLAVTNGFLNAPFLFPLHFQIGFGAKGEHATPASAKISVATSMDQH
jgi:hypothetical protein